MMSATQRKDRVNLHTLYIISIVVLMSFQMLNIKSPKRFYLHFPPLLFEEFFHRVSSLLNLSLFENIQTSGITIASTVLLNKMI